MIGCAASIGGHRVILDPSGAVFWPEARVMAVADLHFEKGTAYDRHGLILPPYDSAETLTALEDAISRLAPARLLALGDSFHDVAGWARMRSAERERIAAVTARVETIWLSGNHDPAVGAALPGHHADLWRQGPFLFRHDPTPAPDARWLEVAGHLHPAARVRVRGQAIRRPCFVAARNRLILPAFGAYTGSLDLSDPAFEPLNLGRHEIYLRGHQRVYRFARSAPELVPALTPDVAIATGHIRSGRHG